MMMLILMLMTMTTLTDARERVRERKREEDLMGKECERHSTREPQRHEEVDGPDTCVLAGSIQNSRWNRHRGAKEFEQTNMPSQEVFKRESVEQVSQSAAADAERLLGQTSCWKGKRHRQKTLLTEHLRELHGPQEGEKTPKPQRQEPLQSLVGSTWRMKCGRQA